MANLKKEVIKLMDTLNRKGITRKGFLTAMGLSTMGLFAGCSLQQPAAPSNGDSKGAGEKTGGTTEITFALDYTPNTNHTGIYVAQEKGYFDEVGLKVTIQQPPADGADALIGAGGAQMGITYQDYIANNLSSSNPLPYTAVAAIIQHNLSGIMSREEDHIVRPRDLNNHTYATWNLPVEQAIIKSVMESDGGDPSTLKMVPYEVDDEVSGLKAKMFDAVWVYEQWAVQNAKVQNFPYNYFAFAAIDKNFDYYTPVIAANDSFAKQNPDAVKSFLSAARKGYEFCVSNPDDAADILLKAVPELDANLVKASQKFLASKYIDDAEKWGVIDSARWQRFYNWLNDQKLLENKIDPSAGFTSEYLG